MMLGDSTGILTGGFDRFEETVHLVEVLFVSRFNAMAEDNGERRERREKDCPMEGHK